MMLNAYSSRPTTAAAAQSQPSNGAQQPTIRLIPSPKLKHRSQWATGDGPGEYGGPPLDVRIRQSWGKQEPDPLTSRDDYIWKKNLKRYLEEISSSSPAPAPSETKELDSGFLSLNRAMSLESMDLDLSQELIRPSKAALRKQEAADRKIELMIEKAKENKKQEWRMAPTRKEEQRWERARKAATGGSDVLLREIAKEKIDPAELSARENKKYKQLKVKLQYLTAAVGGASLMSAYLFYSSEVASSYGVGLVGAIAYIRMLGNSVDSVGRADIKGAVKGAVGQPRLLIPLILTMVFNRWNGLIVPEYGLPHLQLIPMLLGFFTYKVATGIEVLSEIIPALKYENN